MMMVDVQIECSCQDIVLILRIYIIIEYVPNRESEISVHRQLVDLANAKGSNRTSVSDQCLAYKGRNVFLCVKRVYFKQKKLM